MMANQFQGSPGARRAGAWLGLATWVLGTALATEVRAQVLVERVRTFVVGETLGDVVNPPRVFTERVAGTGIDVLTGVKVGLRLVGAPDGFASEMVVMLTKDVQQTSILLNQVGVGVGTGPAASIGYGYSGWDVTFVDSATRGDVHGVDVGGGWMTGEVGPDGRVLPTDSARPGMLAVMNGLQGDGDWSLSVADVGVGGVMRLEQWSLTLTGWTPVPEPSETAGMMALALAAWVASRSRPGRWS